MNKEKNSEYKKVCDANNIMKAAKKCMQGVTWKYSTQNYYLNRIERVRVTKERLEKMDRMSDGFIVFYVNERRKVKKFKEKLEDGEMSYKGIEQQYKSWRGHMEYFNSH